MKIILLALLLCSLGFSQNSLFRSEAPSGLSKAESDNFNHLNNGKIVKFLGIKRQKLISIDNNALSSGSIEAELFDGQKETFNLKMTMNGNDSVWKGALDNNRGNFKLTKRNGAYIGYIFVDGLYFVVTSISNQKAVLYEEDMHYKCGVGGKEAQNAHSH